jgi:hypothetical protein
MDRLGQLTSGAVVVRVCIVREIHSEAEVSTRSAVRLRHSSTVQAVAGTLFLSILKQTEAAVVAVTVSERIRKTSARETPAVIRNAQGRDQWSAGAPLATPITKIANIITKSLPFRNDPS